MPRKGAPKKPTKSQLCRAKYLVTYLRTNSDAQAQHASGLKKNAKRRITEMLEERGTISDAPRPGRPRLYTKALMRKAVQILVENKAMLLTGTMLLQVMISMGLASEHADVDTFMLRFCECVTSIGHKLVVNSTNTIFLLTANDVTLRVMFATKMLGVLASTPLEMVIFTDETILEESPHPKGKFDWSVVWS